MVAEGGRISRRAVLRASLSAGGAFVLGIKLVAQAASAATATAATVGGDVALDAFIRIAPDSTVTLIMPSVEMGQGTYTSVPMILAEELDVSMDKVRFETAPENQKLYGNPMFFVQMTGGSTTIRAWWMPLRKAGAAARAMLVSAAATQWRVDPATCRTDSGTVYHDASGRSQRYGQLAARATTIAPPTEPVLKNPRDFKIIGRPIKRLEAPEKVNGSLKFGIDAMPVGLKFAALTSCPVFGGKVGKVDDRKALALPGVHQVVVLDDMVAVVGKNTWVAQQGLNALLIDWVDGKNASVSSATIWEAVRKAGDGEGIAVENIGDAVGHLQSPSSIHVTYELPFLAHAPMEPMNCTVDVRADECDIWVGTQAMGFARQIAAKESGLPAERVNIHNHLIGGGFGRRLEVDGIGKAVRIAKHVKGPVKVTWSREEDIQQEMYRPVYHTRMSAQLDGEKVVAWRHRVVGAAILARYLPPAFKDGIDGDAIDGATKRPYDFAHRRIEYVRHEPAAVPVSFWRGVGPNNNIFASECFLDRLAHEAKVDPGNFRRGLLAKNPRALAVLELALVKSGWDKPMAKANGTARVGRGICLETAFSGLFAAVAEVSVDDSGGVRVTRVVCAVDCGVVVNPDTVVAQMQGGIIFGLSAVLHGEITIERGRVQQSNFHDYRVMRINETPEIEVHIVPSPELPGGIGEPGTVVVQAAVANAVYAATGVQLTQMPINPKLIARNA
jgi:isoquinoline 1-oxidoreductase beta subunit